MNVLRRLAPTLITAGLVMMLAGGGGMVPVSDSKPADNNYLDRTEAKYAELHQQLQQYIACEVTGWWDEWPCTQFTPPTQVPR